MKKTLTTHEIVNEFLKDEYANWSRSGAFALAEYLEQLEGDTGEEMELDIVSLRCDFAEYESLPAWAVDYFGGESYALEKLALDSLASDEDKEVIREYIQDHGSLIEFEGGVIVSSF